MILSNGIKEEHIINLFDNEVSTLRKYNYNNKDFLETYL